MKKKALSSFITGILCMLMLASASTAVFAADSISTDKQASLKLTYRYNSSALSGVDVRIYRTAAVESNGEYILTDAYENSGVDVNSMRSADQWKSAAVTLASYSDANQISAEQETLTGTDGTVSFTGLKTGLYLVREKVLVKGSRTYTFETFMISLPTLDESGNWTYDVDALPKCEVSSTGGSSGGGGGGGSTTPKKPTTITDTTVPLGTIEAPEGTEIPEEAVPLGNVPKTGELPVLFSAYVFLGLLLIVSGTVISGRENRKKNEKNI